MKKILLTLGLVVGLIFNCYADWDDVTDMQALTVSAAMTQVQDCLNAINGTSGVPPTKINTTSGVAIVSSLGTNLPEVANSIWGASNKLVFEGATADTNETFMTVTDPTADRTVTIPQLSGTMVLSTGTGGDIDIGAYELRAQQLESDIADGTTPMTITSTTKVANLNVDELDGYDSTNMTMSQTFTANGTFTSQAGITRVFLTMCAAGGGGAAGESGGSDEGGGGGGGGQCVIQYPYDVLAETGYAVVINDAGIGGVYGAAQNGTDAGNTSFGGNLTMAGGSGGVEGASGAGGAGGGVALDASGATPGGPGFIGGDGAAGVQGGGGVGGGGGGTALGSGGTGGTTTGAVGDTSGYGAGGGGSGANVDGKAGAPGIVIVEWGAI